MILPFDENYTRKIEKTFISSEKRLALSIQRIENFLEIFLK